MGCCKVWPLTICFANILGIIQVFIQFICFMLLIFIYFFYFPSDAKKLSYNAIATDAALDSQPPLLIESWVDHDLHSNSKLSPLWKQSLYALFGIIFYTLFVFILDGLALIYFSNQTLSEYADALGLISTLSGVVQFVPQIIYTGISKSVGSLSVYMLLMQVPGSFLLSYSLSIQPGANWSSWLSYFVSGALQFILLIMCILFSRNAPPLDELIEPLLQEEEDVYFTPEQDVPKE
jgi:hypothetical protein